MEKTAMNALIELLKVNDIYKECMPYIIEIIEEVYLPMEKKQMHKVAEYWHFNGIADEYFDDYYDEIFGK